MNTVVPYLQTFGNNTIKEIFTIEVKNHNAVKSIAKG